MHELRFERNPFETNNCETNDSIQSNIERMQIGDVLNEMVGYMSHDFRDVLIQLLQK